MKVSPRSPLGALACFAIGGCALLGKSDALTPRYFGPDAATNPMQARAAAAHLPADGVPLELRLGRVTAASYLGERIVFRESNHEVSFYEDRRWSEKPETFLRRALSRSFYEDHGVRRIVSGAGPTLEVELTEFAEVRLASPVARVRVSYILYDARLARREATVTVELPIAANTPDGEGTIRSMTAALSRAVAQIVSQVISELPRPAADPRLPSNARPDEARPALTGQ